MSTKPLAYKLRPKSLEDIIGQDHLVGENGIIRKMIANERYFSLILYGPPGIGKTSIANVVSDAYGLNTSTFNASTDTKAMLKEIISKATRYGVLLIVDEIHRMKKDIQDYLLPHVEKGDVTIIGLTTNNPYHSVNPAVRSRSHVLKLKEISDTELLNFLKKVTNHQEYNLSANFKDDTLNYIIQASNREIRSAINMLEICDIAYPDLEVTVERAKKVIFKPTMTLDKNEDNYYNILSALQKSIRGSDVDASLHYLARLVEMEDLDSILRRLSVIVYEDIGLANTSLYAKMDACANACERLGFPEARIPLANLVVEMALSPKSNTPYKALDLALADLKEGKMGKIPNHLINVANFEAKEAYLYPHDYKNHIVKQTYLPQQLKDVTYFKPTDTSKYERLLKERMTTINRILNKPSNS